MSRLYNILNKLIPESGSNNNGEYVKFPDGTMICTKTVSGTNAITTPFGSWYESAEIDLGAWPQTFAEIPLAVSVSNVTYLAMPEAIKNTTTSNVGQTYLMRPNSVPSQSWQLKIMAIGKWK